MSMDATKATSLRRPFPPESVGKLPKPYKADSPKGNCPECHGYHGLPAVHLDYVGHAATTDRLLTVDPEWSWEPMAFDQFGSPMCDKDGNLWIKLTICGVTRLGCGDGKSMKERIGDAIRNAAMRFGVALDLWAKEDLVEFAQAVAGQPSTPPTSSAGEPPATPPAGHAAAPPTPAEDPPITDKTRRRMFALFTQKGVDETEQLPGINHITGKTYTSRADITEPDGLAVIEVLLKRPDVEKAGDQ